MRVAMFTNTYAPVVGGLERSLLSFADAFRQRGHDVLIVAPTFAHTPPEEPGVLRVPALHHVTRHDFSMTWPLPPHLQRRLQQFKPDLLHAHHPFLLGNTALRMSRLWQRPLLFTHHIFFEQYAHYLKPMRLDMAQRFLVALATGYENLCDHVIAPSESIAAHLRVCGVTTPITVVPTGILVRRFAAGEGAACRRAAGIPSEAFVVGHVGRLAPEKNLGFLGKALAGFLQLQPEAHAILVGDGASKSALQETFMRAGVARRVHFLGVLPEQALVDAYHAMDVFAFASKSETQGIVLVEAMATGRPVVALEASGVREVVQEGINGRLLMAELVPAFIEALTWIQRCLPAQRTALQEAARRTAARFSVERCASRALAVYRQVCAHPRQGTRQDTARWRRLVQRWQTEARLAATMTRAARAAFAFSASTAGSQSSVPGP